MTRLNGSTEIALADSRIGILRRRVRLRFNVVKGHSKTSGTKKEAADQLGRRLGSCLTSSDTLEASAST